MELSLTSFLLLVCVLGLLAGFLGGLGGRRAAMWNFRYELAVLSTQVDPKLGQRMAALSAEVEKLAGRTEAALSTVQSVKGDLGAIKKSASKPAFGPDDLEFVVAAVSERLLARPPLKAAT